MNGDIIIHSDFMKPKKRTLLFILIGAIIFLMGGYVRTNLLLIE